MQRSHQFGLQQDQLLPLLCPAQEAVTSYRVLSDTDDLLAVMLLCFLFETYVSKGCQCSNKHINTFLFG